jgi:hypothetical protein
MIYKPGDKRLVRDFTDLVELINASTGINPFESAGDKKRRVDGLLSHYENFCMYYFPEYCFAPMGAFQKNIQREVAENPNHIFLEQWSRGFAKSTHFGVFLPLFLKFNGLLNGMITGSYNETLACERLADIQANLQGNQRIINDFGEQYSLGNWEDGKFKTKDNVGFYAFGKGQSPRGTRFKHKRPNYGLVDDLNDARQLKNPAIALEDKRWVLEELKPALWTRQWWLVVAQNKFHDNAVTALLENDPEIKTTIHKVNIVNDAGESNWPENPDFNDAAIQALNDTEGAGYTRERMNTPFEEGTTFKAEWLNVWVDCDKEKYGTLIHYLDPSYKATDKSDFKAWILLGKTGKYYDIILPWIRRTTSKTMWEHAYEVDDEYDEHTISHSMEAGFIQEEVHEKELERVSDDKGYMARIGYDKRDKGDKFERIETMQSLFQRGLIRFNVHQKDNPDMRLLRTQILAIEKGSRINDDGPDALEGAIWMADKHKGREGKKQRSGKFKKNKAREL